MSLIKSNSKCYILHAATEVYNWFGFKFSVVFVFLVFQIHVFITNMHVNTRQMNLHVLYMYMLTFQLLEFFFVNVKLPLHCLVFKCDFLAKQYGEDR